MSSGNEHFWEIFSNLRTYLLHMFLETFKLENAKFHKNFTNVEIWEQVAMRAAAECLWCF